MSHTGWGEWPTWLDETSETPACRGHDTNLFFPEAARDGGRPTQQVAEARAICDRCPLKAPCAEWAIRQGPYLAGVWGGTTYSQRRKTITRSTS